MVIYKFIGTIVPSIDAFGFSFPVFERGNKKFIQSINSDGVIEEFLEIEDFEDIDLENEFIPWMFTQELYKEINNQALYCYSIKNELRFVLQKNMMIVLLGYLKEIYNYDASLYDDISNFKSEVSIDYSLLYRTFPPFQKLIDSYHVFFENSKTLQDLKDINRIGMPIYEPLVSMPNRGKKYQTVTCDCGNVMRFEDAFNSRIKVTVCDKCNPLLQGKKEVPWAALITKNQQMF